MNEATPSKHAQVHPPNTLGLVVNARAHACGDQHTSQMALVQFSTDLLVELLSHLAYDGAMRTFDALAYCTHNNTDLAERARRMPCPFVVVVQPTDKNHTFSIPVENATVISVCVDWGDGSGLEVVTSPRRELRHIYTAAGLYTVRVQAYGIPQTRGVWLDAVGYTMERGRPFARDVAVRYASLGNLGVRSLAYFFSKSDYTGPVDWNTHDVTNMRGMFYYAANFNQPIGTWDVSKVTDMSCMFSGASAFNQPIGTWDVSEVTDMSYMFYGAIAFNQPIGTWDVGKVTDMCHMLYAATAFNQPIGDWDVGKVTNMSYMFCAADAFNQPIGTWDVGKVTDMSFMFSCATAFNQPIGTWDVGKVTDMSYMFEGAVAFKQDLLKW
jgi:surface protein